MLSESSAKTFSGLLQITGIVLQTKSDKTIVNSVKSKLVPMSYSREDAE